MNALPDSENDRLALIRSLDLVSAVDSPELERIADLASHAFAMPTVLISLVDRDEQIFLCRVGFEAERTERSISVCTHAIEQRDVFEIDDLTLDARFSENPLVVSGPRIRFYAGAPLVTSSGHAIGTLCLIDYVPRHLNDKDRQRLKGYAALVVDQLKLRRSIGRMDAVSGLHNRQQFTADLAALETHANLDAALYLVEFIDVQSAHLLSQSRGMLPVESLIRQAAERMKEAMPQGCELYHVAVARFAFFVPRSGHAPEQAIAEGLRNAFKAPLTAEGLKLKAAIRIGVVPFQHRQWRDVVRRAISAVQLAIENDQPYSVYDPAYDAKTQRALRIAGDADKAIEQDQFHLVYQPRYNVKHGTFDKAEVLLRWHHPELGELGPCEFIPLLEKTATMTQVTDWVIEHAFAQLAAWRLQGLQISLSLNVAAADFAEGALWARLKQALARHALPASAIEVEVTEGEWLKPGGSAAAQLAELISNGVGVSLDDFGAGFCNFGYLTRLPINGLKIDRAMVTGVHTNPVLAGIAQAILQMAHVMKLTVVAEGVEEAGDLAFFKQAGCDEIQGYLFSKPLAAEAALAFFRQAGTGSSTSEYVKALMS